MRSAKLFALPLLFVVAGCASPGMLGWLKRDFPRADARHPVSEIVCVWEQAQGMGVDHVPTRGFAGQIMFFINGSAAPVAVDGDVRIYVFDDHAEDPTKPLHQFDFPGDVWDLHLRQNPMLGATYNVFIPYTRRGRQQAACSLRLQLTSPEGRVMYSDAVQVVLPGPNDVAEREAQAMNRFLVETTSGTGAETIDRLRPSRSARERAAEMARDRWVTKIDTSAPRSEDSGIVQASATDEEPETDPKDERIRRLEQQLARLLELQHAPSSYGDDAQAAAHRFASEHAAPARPHPSRDAAHELLEDEIPARTARPAARELLESDDLSRPARSSMRDGHPLMDDGPSRAALAPPPRLLPGGTRQLHPLASRNSALLEEEPASDIVEDVPARWNSSSGRSARRLLEEDSPTFIAPTVRDHAPAGR